MIGEYPTIKVSLNEDLYNTYYLSLENDPVKDFAGADGVIAPSVVVSAVVVFYDALRGEVTSFSRR